MKTIAVQKFPKIFFQNRQVIWDSRQPLEGNDEWVLLFGDEYVAPEHQAALEQRPRAKKIGRIGTSCDLKVENPRKFLGEISSLYFGEPSRNLVVVGITGTNGKTTSTLLLGHLLQATGATVALLGTLGVQIWQAGKLVVSEETGFTTPEAPTLHQLFKDFCARGVTHVVMEVSSHALRLERVGGVDFDSGIFTNLTQDHLDFHKTMASYEAAKAKLFHEYLVERSFSAQSGLKDSTKTRSAVINANDPAGLRLVSSLPLGFDVLTFVENKNYHIARQSIEGTAVTLNGTLLESPLVGRYNVENILGAYLAATKLHPSDAPQFVEALKQFSGARGRLERVAVKGQEPKKHVFVDYAHTPDALEKVLSTLASLKTKGALLWTVFGCGGDRDTQKRPIMGAIAQKFADRLVVTSDNPRTEDPKKILEDILRGMSLDSQKVHVEIDREKAIALAITSMAPGDLLVIAGKGHEDYQIIGKSKIHFSDVEVAEKFLAVNT